MDELAAADVHPHVAEIDAQEHEISRLNLVERHMGVCVELGAREVIHRNARLRPRPLREARAVKDIWPGCPEDVRLSQLSERFGDGDRCAG